MGTWVRAGLVLLAVAAVSGLTACGGDDGDGRATTLRWFIFNEPSGAPQTVADRCSERSDGRYRIQFEFLPSDADSQREQLVRRLGAEDSSIDIIGMDVIWTGEFANAGWIRAVPSEIRETVTRDVFESVLESASFEDRLFAVPIWSNTQLLWYRKDRVDEAPQTWGEMIDRAEGIGREEGRIQVQGDFYEGLVVWANALIESAGTSILDGPDEVRLEREATERALAIMGKLGRSPVRAPDFTTSNEDSARLGFEAGEAAFMINYPFVHPSAEENAPDVFEQMEAAKYPAVERGQESRPPLGGINLAVSSFSRHPDLAWEAIECLVGGENQLEIAEEGGLPPVRSDLYDADEIEDVYPGFADVVRDSIESAAPRPAESPAYQDLSLAIQRALHPTGDIDPNDPSEAYERLRERVEQAVEREGLL
jgi:multiple sugar transport system substrate-binding protein